MQSLYMVLNLKKKGNPVDVLNIYCFVMFTISDLITAQCAYLFQIHQKFLLKSLPD